MYDEVVIDATSIREGGGYTLLCCLVDKLESFGCAYKVYGNEYLRGKADFDVVLTSYKTLWRLYFTGIDHCLYFCNRSPIFARKEAVVYIHNEYSTYSIAKILTQNIKFKRKIAYLINHATNLLSKKFGKALFIVQTNSMRQKLEECGFKSKVLPVFNIRHQMFENKEKIWDFCYISYPWEHKNHKTLLEAMKNDSSGNGFSLALTIPDDGRFVNLIDLIESINNQGRYKIHNFGALDKSAVNGLYSSSKALLFLSSKESFGLPLIEAAQFNLPIIAQNLPYVDDVVGGVYFVDMSDLADMMIRLNQYASRNLSPSYIKVSDMSEELIELVI